MILILSIILIILSISFLFIYKKNLSQTEILLEKILVLSQQELNLEHSIQLIEYSREYTMIFIQQINKKKMHPSFKELIHKLLGLVLQVPRTDEQDILKAIQQIETINRISEELKDFFITNQQTLKKTQ